MPDCDSPNTLNGAINQNVCKFSRVCLGGTFDGLHAGHRTLLTTAALLSRDELLIGIVADNTDMIKKKTLSELIRPFAERRRFVLEFLCMVKPSLYTTIVPLNDPWGPAVERAELDGIVVSEETRRGALRINELRAAKGMSPLGVHMIRVEPEPNRASDIEEAKISSSSLRIRRLGTILRPPHLQAFAKIRADHNTIEAYMGVDTGPYLIGLTGGIACGKSTVGAHLESLGAGIVDYDKLGHESYLPGSPAYEKIVAAFGEGVISDEGDSIDRKRLGAVVFSDKAQMSRLNHIVWPVISEAALREAVKLYTEGHRVVVMDAAVLLEAQWDQYMHEVWTVLLPPEMAISRLMQRNGLTREEAEQRVNIQMPGAERVTRSHVVFSNQWHTEFLKQQVTQAWSLLISRLPELASITPITPPNASDQ